MNRPFPRLVPGHQNIDAAVPRLGTGNNRSKASAARLFDVGVGATGVGSIDEGEGGMRTETQQKML
jgi:hypothetical protein